MTDSGSATVSDEGMPVVSPDYSALRDVVEAAEMHFSAQSTQMLRLCMRFARLRGISKSCGKTQVTAACAQHEKRRAVAKRNMLAK